MDPTRARETIAAAISAIAPEVDLAGCDDHLPFAAQLDLDSMDVLSLLTSLTEQTGVEIPDGALEPGWSLEQLVEELVARS